MQPPRVFTIPASSPFLPTLIRALAERCILPFFPTPGDDLAWSRATLYLPTRRACRLARDIFLDVLAKDAAVLPRIVALGDMDEDELALPQARQVPPMLALEPAPTLSSLERRLLLTRLVQRWAASEDLHGGGGAPLVACNPTAALGLADDLARLMDDMTTRQIPWDRLDSLVPDEFDVYWQLSLRFLKLAREMWPEILEERGLIEPAVRRDQLIAAEAARLQASAVGPVIAAGSTGSMPATAAFLATVATLPLGAIILPGLDVHLDESSWRHIGGYGAARGEAIPEHPQFAMQALIARMGVSRELVAELAKPAGRDRLLSEVFRPAATTERWYDGLDANVVEQALASIELIEAANSEEEGLAIAVALREALDRPEATVALVTADPLLARRVATALGRWNVLVEESGGTALAETQAGVFARLAARVALEGTPPALLLALLKHPLCMLSPAADWNRPAVATLERAMLRGPRPRPGASGLVHGLAAFRQGRDLLHRNDPRRQLTNAELDAAADLLTALAAALAPLESMAAGPHSLQEITLRHRDVVSMLCREAAGCSGVGAENALAATFDAITSSESARDLLMDVRDYPDVFRSLAAACIVRAPPTPGARVHILGPLEMRLQSFDAVVLGGLVEGSWPPEMRNDPWLSRPLRRRLGLDLPERRIGLSAHDFAEALGTPRVILARAVKHSGTPTVPSRFLRRLAAVAGEARWQQVLARGQHLLALARAVDRPPRASRLEAPQPRPPREARPSYVSVTDVEHWLRDPYTIYAKHVLLLFPVDPVDTPLGVRDRGNLVHAAISEFTQITLSSWPDDPVAELLRIGRKHFAVLEDDPQARALWWPRFLRIAKWFAAWQGVRRAQVRETLTETRGEIVIPLSNRSFRLATRADRIDRLATGGYAVIDYKTGQAWTERQVRAGLAPQLTLEAAILRNGGFPGIPGGCSVESLAYVTLRGGDPPGDLEEIVFEQGTPDSQADRALARFAELMRRFDLEDQPFRSLAHPMWIGRYGEYDHLARVKEWSATGGVVEPGALP
jgi:ATP-dependent helicase/nuclease subunit B